MSLLGQDSITITDITDVNPIRLDLTSSQPIYQTKKTGENYEPDYTVNPLIITPSLYFGTREVNEEEYRSKIEFYINGVLVENTEKIYVENSILYMKQNLTTNIKIEVIIRNITDTSTKVTYEEVKNSISFYYLSYDSSSYTTFIDSQDGRYDFSSNNSSDITLIAHLYSGSTELNPIYEWKRSSGTEITNNSGKSINIARSDIDSHENFICIMSYDDVNYVATCAVDDRTDEYTGVIISSGSLIMSPAFDTATFTCQILKNGNIIEVNESLNYSWALYANNSKEMINLSEKGASISLTLGEGNVPRNSFTLYCTTKIDGKYTVVSYLPIAYKNSGYTAYIQSENGRYDFSSENDSNIKLTAYLYDGTTELNPSYKWKRSSGLIIPEPTTNKSLEVGRTDIHSHENFICEMTYEGITYVTVCPIDDRTDEYTGVIVSNKSLVMSPISNAAIFTCKIFKNGKEININSTKENFSYSWILYSNGSSDGIEIESNQKQVELTIDGTKIPKDSFTLYCTTTIDGKNIVVSYLPITYKNGGYTALINSEDGRYDFSSDKSGPIKLTAHLYDGIKELVPTYLWKRSSGLEITKPKEEKNLTIERADIYSHENFICEMKYEGLTYTTTCAIDDRTDLYTSTIISDASLVMTPSFKTANFTCKIFKNQNEVIDGTIEYSWIYYENGSSNGIRIAGNTKNITVTLGGENMPKDSFTLYCTAIIDDKFTTVAYLPISYSVSYTPILTPKTIFIPANHDGSYQGEEARIEKELIFFLQDESGSQIESNLTNFSISGKEGIAIGTVTHEGNKKYTIPFSIDALSFKKYDVSELFELSYTYKSQSFNEEFYIVKSVQGNDGKEGPSGSSYSLILSNDYHRFAGKEAFADSNQEASTKIQFYRGDELMILKDIRIRDVVLTTTEQVVIEGLTAKLDIDTNATEKTITFTTGDAGNRLAQGGTLTIEVDVEINGKIKTFSTTFSYDINFEGHSYFLSFINGTSIIYYPSKNSFSPKKIEFYTYYRRNGAEENFPYVNGKVFYSEDGGNKNALNSKDGAAYYEYSINQNLQSNVTFYLYTDQANDASPEEKYLMDRETIPILTSFEGAEIGGENLIRFSRTLESGANKWFYKYGVSDEIRIIEGNGFNNINFNFKYSTDTETSNKGECYIISPPFFIDKEIRDKDLCFSYYFKINSDIESVKKAGNKIYFSFLGYDNTGNLLEESGFSIFDIKVDDDKIIENSRWLRLYEIFKANILVSSNISYFKIKIGGIIKEGDTTTSYDFDIKKPKLEVGNTPTAWSLAADDIIFEGISIDSTDLNGSSIVDLLKEQIKNIQLNSNSIGLIQGNMLVNITDINGNKISYTNLQDLYNYLNTNINTIIELQNNENLVINTKLNTISANLEGLYKIQNKIELGYDNNNAYEPYMLFDVASGENGVPHNYSMKLTTKRLSFLSDNKELAYFGNTSLTIERARVREGIYLGSGTNTGYLVIKTTEQGCAFMWESNFNE